MAWSVYAIYLEPVRLDIKIPAQGIFSSHLKVLSNHQSFLYCVNWNNSLGESSGVK